jgi:hypothetical protein
MAAVPTSPTAAKAAGAGEPRAAGSTGLPYLAFVISVIVAGLCLLVYLLNEGERGNTIAGPAALFVAIVNLISTFVIWLVDNRRIRIEVPRWLGTVLKTLAVLALLSTLAIAGWIVSKVLKTADIPVTEALRITGSVGMADGSEAIIGIPDPTRRNQLALIPKLRNNGPSGNCVGSATLDSRLLVNGVARQSVKGARPFSEIRFLLEEPVQTASVAITVHMRDPACQVDLLIHEAVLFSDER